ncbi:hypothetical protein BDFB_001395 [Asbolus verrucosus]|uniref:Lig chan domain containing protein n=1 Tax=Asbolus verrucosus TaxID=1661398 RepID=A0A482VPZ3_ASBVE|nr:hypothetical protein BDFB_001395 [Asbolus verrucosus]
MHEVLIQLFCILQLITIGTTKVGISPLQTNESLTEDCVSNILSRHFQPNQLVLAVNISFVLNYPSVRLQVFENIEWMQLARVNIYIISTDRGDFKAALQHLADFRNFNPRAKLILIWGDQVDEEIFETFVKFYMTRVVVVELPSLKLFTYSPYRGRNVAHPNTTVIPLGYCSESYKNLRLFAKKLPKTWENTVVRISYVPLEPYDINPEEDVKGMEIYTLESIKKFLKFKTQYSIANVSYYDEKKPETFYEAYGRLLTHEVDIALGAFYLKDFEHIDLDTSYAYLQDGFFWVVPKGQIIDQWKRIVLAFGFITWIAFLLSFLFFSGIYWIYMYFFQMGFSSNIFFYFFGILIESTVNIPQKYQIRGLLVTWIFYCLIISTAFKSQMMNLLSGIDYEHQIDSLEEIIESPLRINMPQGYANLYDNEEYPLERYVYENNIRCDDILKCLQRTAKKRDTASTAIGRYIDFMRPQFLDKNGRSMIHVLNEKVYPMSIHMIFSKGYPIFGQIDHLLLIMEANGITDFLYDRITHILNLRYMTKTGPVKYALVNDVKTMVLPFVILGFGQVLGFVVFCLELLWSQVCKNTNKICKKCW